MPVTIVKVQTKGAPLTIQEFDANFQGISDWIDAMEGGTGTAGSPFTLSAKNDGAGEGGRIVLNGTSGYSEIGYIDVYQNKLRLWLTSASPITFDAAGVLTNPGRVDVGNSAGAAGLRLKPGASADHCFISFCARSATPSTQSGYIGYDVAATALLTIKNQLSGAVVINTNSKNWNFNTSGITEFPDDIWVKTADGDGVEFYGGAKVYKASGTGLCLKAHSDAHMPKVETTGGDKYFITPVQRGAWVYRSTDYTHSSSGTGVAVPFANEQYDTDTIHDNSTNPSRLTVPSNVTKVRFLGQLSFATNSNGLRGVWLYKNGADMGLPVKNTLAPCSAYPTIIQIYSPPLTVTSGDYFELVAYQNSGGNLDILTGESWFVMEILG